MSGPMLGNLSEPEPIVVAALDYANSHDATIATLRADAAKLNGGDAETAARKRAQADELEAKGPPSVKYHASISLHCNGKGCPSPDFTASFPEVQRILACPTCGREVHVPERYRGLP